MNQMIRNMCSNASFIGGTATTREVDDFLENHSTLYFCRGRAFELIFNKITENTIQISRRWIK